MRQTDPAHHSAVASVQGEEQTVTMRVLVAEALRLVRQGLRLLLEREGDITVVAEASDGREAVELAIEHKPDLVLMDVDMPTLDGVAATKLIHGRLPDTKILMLAVYDEDMRIVAAMQAGAFGYVLKDADHTEFLRIIRATYRGEHVRAPFVPDLFARRAVTAVQAASDEKALLSGLTDREREILACAAAGRSNKEIADQLCVSIDTVKTHLHHIYRKLSVNGRVEAVLAYLHAK
jgi:DNA-binding NarL/FixJ family response regulator